MLFVILFSYSEPLQYYWDRVEVIDPEGNICDDENIREYLPMPIQAKFSDHNRILQINNIFLYDAGTYRCSVRRPGGTQACKTGQILLQCKY